MNSEWNSIIIHERGFTTLVEDINGNLTNATYSFNGSFCKTQEYLGMDRFNETFFLGSSKFSKQSSKLNEVHRVHAVPFINHEILKI